MIQLVVGDVVRLNSGGPNMLVILQSHGVALCQWSEYSGSASTVHQALFRFETLTLVSA